MAIADDLHARATRLLAMALAATERGDFEAAERLTIEASRCFDEATGLTTPRPEPQSPPAHPAAEQQIQSKERPDTDRDSRDA